MSEDDTFNALKGLPADQVYTEFLNNMLHWDIDQRTAFIHRSGWTVEKFNMEFDDWFINSPFNNNK